VQRTWKELLPGLDHGRIATTNREQQDWHQLELWLHWHVNSDRSDVRLPSLVCGPTNAKDPQRTPATVSLCDLQGLQKNFLPSHALVKKKWKFAARAKWQPGWEFTWTEDGGWDCYPCSHALLELNFAIARIMLGVLHQGCNTHFNEWCGFEAIQCLYCNSCNVIAHFKH
jgi:hypothetical protein